MKHRKFVVWPGALVLLCLATLLLGCPTEANDEDIVYVPPTLTFTEFSASNGVKYYSLTTGEELTETTDIQSNKWDIAIEYKGGTGPMIYTNSGASVTAAGGGYAGNGGVLYTDSTDFGSVVLADAIDTDALDFDDDLTSYVEDTIAYVTASAVEHRLNVMTFFGYSLGTGISNDPYKPSGMTYAFDKKAFFYWTTMPPDWTPTNQVYIITHGDGSGHSKLQVSAIQYINGAKVNFTITYEKL